MKFSTKKNFYLEPSLRLNMLFISSIPTPNDLYVSMAFSMDKASSSLYASTHTTWAALLRNGLREQGNVLFAGENG